MKITTVNRELPALRRMFTLSDRMAEGGKSTSPKVRTLPGEAHRDRVVYGLRRESLFRCSALDRFQRHWTRCTNALPRGSEPHERGETPIKPRDPFSSTMSRRILADCGVRGREECFPSEVGERYQGDCDRNHTREDEERTTAEFRLGSCRFDSEVCGAESSPGRPSVFPARNEKAATSSRRPSAGPSMESLRRSRRWSHFPIYTFRHTCLTRWAPHMVPWTLAYLAGHSNMATTKRYVHPQLENTRLAIERAQKRKPDWARFWAHFERGASFESSESSRNSLIRWSLVVGGESLELPTFWV